MAPGPKHDIDAGLGEPVGAAADVIEIANHQGKMVQLMGVGANERERVMIGVRVAALERELTIIALHVIENAKSKLRRQPRKRLVKVGDVDNAVSAGELAALKPARRPRNSGLRRSRFRQVFEDRNEFDGGFPAGAEANVDAPGG